MRGVLQINSRSISHYSRVEPDRANGIKLREWMDHCSLIRSRREQLEIVKYKLIRFVRMRWRFSRWKQLANVRALARKWALHRHLKYMHQFVKYRKLALVQMASWHRLFLNKYFGLWRYHTGRYLQLLLKQREAYDWLRRVAKTAKVYCSLLALWRHLKIRTAFQKWYHKMLIVLQKGNKVASMHDRWVMQGTLRKWYKLWRAGPIMRIFTKIYYGYKLRRSFLRWKNLPPLPQPVPVIVEAAITPPRGHRCDTCRCIENLRKNVRMRCDPMRHMRIRVATAKRAMNTATRYSYEGNDVIKGTAAQAKINLRFPVIPSKNADKLHVSGEKARSMESPAKPAIASSVSTKSPRYIDTSEGIEVNTTAPLYSPSEYEHLYEALCDSTNLESN